MGAEFGLLGQLPGPGGRLRSPAGQPLKIEDAGGNWYGENEALPEELEAAVEDYRVLLYNHVFDKKNRVEGFFTLTE